MAERKPVDWEAIEREYRAGQLSVSEIGRQHGVSHTAINKRAKRYSWTRNLAERVRQEVSTQLVSDEVSAKTDRETIKVVAARVVQVVREHRDDIATARRIVRSFFGELEVESAAIEDIEAAIIDETADDKTGHRRAAMLRAVSLPTRAGVVKDLAMALKSLIPMEREAFGLDNAEDGTAKVVNNTSVSLATVSPAEAAATYQKMINGR